MEQWKQYKIGDLCSISSSKRIFAKEYQTSGIPFYRGKEVIEKQNALMRKAFKAVYEKAKQYNVTLRVAAYMVALGSLEEAMKIRGMI